jgi:NADP-dependent 3-hydroxy acid dehydrogenase YdfG
MAPLGAGRLAGRYVLISGGTSGLGRALVSACIAAGARVGVLGRRAELLEEIAAETGAVVATCDVADRDATDAAVARVAEALGGLDALVNTAGVMMHSRISDGHTEDWRQMLEVNMMGTMHATRAALPFLRAASLGDVLVVSSVAADRVAAPEFAMYSATKAGLARLAEGVRAELRDAPHVRVTLVKPGYIDTEAVTAHIRDEQVRGETAARASELGMAPAMLAEELVHVLALPRELNVIELAIVRARPSA